MRKILALLVLLIINCLIARAELLTYQAPGRTIFSVYDHKGNLVFCYEKPGLGIFLADSGVPEHNDPQFHTHIISGDAYSLRLKKNHEGRLWMTWEQSFDGITSVHLARYDVGRIKEKTDIDHHAEGKNHSPDFDFDSSGDIWMTWVHQTEGQHQVLVSDTANAFTWNVNPSPALPAYTPRIVAASRSSVWIFWISQGDGHYRISSCRYDGKNWSEVSELNLDKERPHVFPEIALDDLGHPWVVWSGYDGQDYEIWYSSWDGYTWSPERPITSNRNLSDMYPIIRFLPGNIPLIAWSQQGSASQIRAVFRENGVWSPEACLVQDKGFNRRPQIALGNKVMCLSWENILDQNHSVRVKEFTFDSIIDSKTEVYYPEDRFPVNFDFRQGSYHHPAQLELKENLYIAFGDSITYGVLARTWFPDEGYVPRLEILLKTFINGARVLNRGVPGEQTWEGLARLDEVLAASGAKYILIMEGTNDMTGSIPSETAAFNLEEMVKKCLDSGVYPLIATIIPRSDSLWKHRIKEPTLKLNQLIRQMVLSYALPLVDQYDQFMSCPEGYLALFSDGAHPNVTGYQQMAENWFDHILRIPYPPLHVTAERKLNRILFYDEHLNLLSWEENSLWTSDQHISALYIHRRLQGDGTLDFDLIKALPPETFQYTDRDIANDKTYLYFIQVESSGGVRGPVSRVVSDR